MAMTDFTIIRRSMTSRLFSTIVTILMVAVSVAMLLVLLSMRESGQRAFSRGKGNMHMLVSRDDSSLDAVLNGIFHRSPPRRFIEWAKYQQIVGGAVPAYRKLAWAIPIQQGDSYRGYAVVATTPDFFGTEDEEGKLVGYEPNVGAPWQFAAGRALEGTFEVVVGSAAAQATGLGVGDEISLTHGASDSGGAAAGAHEHHEYPYTVVGVLESTGGPHDRALFSDLDSAWIIHANDRRKREDPDAAKATAADLTDDDRKITGLYVRVATREGSEISGSLQEVFDAFRRDPTLVVADPVTEIQGLFRIISNIDQILVAMAAIVLISSGIAIMLALYNSMEQRRRQIAILRVLGSSKENIFGLIVTESALLGLLGALAGIVLAIIGGQVVATIMKARLGLYIEPRLAYEVLLAVVVGTVILASLAGVVPALMAYRTPVVRNLRPLG